MTLLNLRNILTGVFYQYGNVEITSDNITKIIPKEILDCYGKVQ